MHRASTSTILWMKILTTLPSSQPGKILDVQTLPEIQSKNFNSSKLEDPINCSNQEGHQGRVQGGEKK